MSTIKMDVSPKEPNFSYLSNHFGYKWTSKSNYWAIWTLWEPEVLDTLGCLLQLVPQKLEVVRLHLPEFLKTLHTGFSVFSLDHHFQDFNPADTPYAILRLEFEENEEIFDSNERIVRIRATEIVFSYRGASQRFQPVHIIAGGGMADILRAISKNSDICVAYGTIKRQYYEDKPLILLNFDNDDGDIQLIRLTFGELEESTRMVEMIRPTENEDLYIFKYFLGTVAGNKHMTLTRSREFKWGGDKFPNRRLPLYNQDIRVPIQHDNVAAEVYSKIIQRHSQIPQRSAPPQPPPRRPQSAQARALWSDTSTSTSSTPNDDSMNTVVFFSGMGRKKYTERLYNTTDTPNTPKYQNETAFPKPVKKVQAPSPIWKWYSVLTQVIGTLVLLGLGVMLILHLKDSYAQASCNCREGIVMKAIEPPEVTSSFDLAPQYNYVFGKTELINLAEGTKSLLSKGVSIVMFVIEWIKECFGFIRYANRKPLCSNCTHDDYDAALYGPFV